MSKAKKDTETIIKEEKEKIRLKRVKQDKIRQFSETSKQCFYYVISLMVWSFLTLIVLLSCIGFLALIYYYIASKACADRAMTVFQCLTGLVSLILGGIGLKVTFQSIKNTTSYNNNTPVVRAMANAEATGTKAQDEIVDY